MNAIGRYKKMASTLVNIGILHLFMRRNMIGEKKTSLIVIYVSSHLKERINDGKNARE